MSSSIPQLEEEVIDALEQAIQEPLQQPSNGTAISRAILESYRIVQQHIADTSVRQQVVEIISYALTLDRDAQDVRSGITQQQLDESRAALTTLLTKKEPLVTQRPRLPPLLLAIINDPENTDLRMVYADWLDDQGYEVRADLIRVQCELAEGNPSPERRAQLLENEERLFAGWTKRFPHFREYHMERGFCISVSTLPSEYNDKDLGQLLLDSPMATLNLFIGNDAEFPSVFEKGTALGQLHTLDLISKRCRGVRLQAVLDSPHLRSLECLWLVGNGLQDEDAIAIANAKLLPSLKRLYLNNNEIGRRGALALCESPLFRQLEGLNLCNNLLSEDTVQRVRAAWKGDPKMLLMNRAPDPPY